METKRTKKVFFVSECLLNQNIRAYGVSNTKGEGALQDIVNLLTAHGCGITVVPCPEIPYEGLKRTACGKERYENSAYRNLCSSLAKTIVDRYSLYLDDNYKVGGFICVNGSPSCGSDFCYGNGTRQEEPGIFIEELQKQLQEKQLTMEFIGVRVKELDTVIKKISDIIQKLS
jgi:predicted secreted protein